MLHYLHTSIPSDPMWHHNEKSLKKKINTLTAFMGTHMELLCFLSKACGNINNCCTFKVFYDFLLYIIALKLWPKIVILCH